MPSRVRTLLVVSALLAGAFATQPLSAGAASTTCGTANLALTQAAGLAANGSQVAYTLTVTNTGPCNATDLVLTDTLPAGVSLYQFTSLNPNSWTCPSTPVSPPSSTGSVTVSCTLGQLSGPNSTQQNPGTAAVTLLASVPATASITNYATVTADQASTTTLNESWGGYAPDGGTITQGSIDLGGSQTSGLGFPSGSAGSGQVQNLKAGDVPGCAGCFGTPRKFTSSTLPPGIRKTLTFYYLAGGLSVSYGQLGMNYIPDGSTGGWQPVPACRGSNPPDPCFSTSKTYNRSGALYYVVTVLTSSTSEWWG